MTAPARRVRRIRTMAPAVKKRERRANMGPVEEFRVKLGEVRGRIFLTSSHDVVVAVSSIGML